MQDHEFEKDWLVKRAFIYVYRNKLFNRYVFAVQNHAYHKRKYGGRGGADLFCAQHDSEPAAHHQADAGVPHAAVLGRRLPALDAQDRAGLLPARPNDVRLRQSCNDAFHRQADLVARNDHGLRHPLSLFAACAACHGVAPGRTHAREDAGCRPGDGPAAVACDLRVLRSAGVRRLSVPSIAGLDRLRGSRCSGSICSTARMPISAAAGRRRWSSGTGTNW